MALVTTQSAQDSGKWLRDRPWLMGLLIIAFGILSQQMIGAQHDPRLFYPALVIFAGVCVGLQFRFGRVFEPVTGPALPVSFALLKSIPVFVTFALAYTFIGWLVFGENRIFMPMLLGVLAGSTRFLRLRQEFTERKAIIVFVVIAVISFGLLVALRLAGIKIK